MCVHQRLTPLLTIDPLTCVCAPTGCTPVDWVPPCVHVFLHYGSSAQRFGVLAWYMLMCFERFNKKIKNLVGNATHPIASLKTALLRDAGVDRSLVDGFTTITTTSSRLTTWCVSPYISGILQSVEESSDVATKRLEWMASTNYRRRVEVHLVGQAGGKVTPRTILLHVLQSPEAKSLVHIAQDCGNQWSQGTILTHHTCTLIHTLLTRTVHCRRTNRRHSKKGVEQPTQWVHIYCEGS